MPFNNFSMINNVIGGENEDETENITLASVNLENNDEEGEDEPVYQIVEKETTFKCEQNFTIRSVP